MVTATFAIGQGLPFLKDLAESRGAAKTIYEIIEKKSTIDILDVNDKKILTEFKGNISFENVEFSYPQRLNVKILKKLNLKIPANRTIALCGGSGCGKSTTIQLLQRFYDLSGGVIKIDGVNINELDLQWLRSQIAVVSQEPVLFSTSIK
jgi:ATP-binding cassette subfamily B (MDR/TAP) protein 1